MGGFLYVFKTLSCKSCLNFFKHSFYRILPDSLDTLRDKLFEDKIGVELFSISPNNSFLLGVDFGLNSKMCLRIKLVLIYNNSSHD